MKTLFLSLTLWVIYTSALANTQLNIATEVTFNNDAVAVYQNSIVSGTSLQISSAGKYELLVKATETDSGKALLNVVLKANGETQTPTLLADYDKQVGFEVDGTSVYLVVSRS